MVGGIYSAGSYHDSDGVNVVMLDGSAHFIMNDIDAGDSTRSLSPSDSDSNGESPFGVWGALGTIAGNEKHTDY